ncbi:hypothetical protein Lser_V15G26705 [Lactuca serriola]
MDDLLAIGFLAIMDYFSPCTSFAIVVLFSLLSTFLIAFDWFLFSR